MVTSTQNVSTENIPKMHNNIMSSKTGKRLPEI